MDVVEKIRRLIELMNENALAELEVEEPELRIRIKTDSSPVHPVSVLAAPMVPEPIAPAQAVPGLPSGAAGAPQAAGPSAPELAEIASPMVGTFYRSPSDGAEPYVTVGTVVEPETMVCIIEAMKVMNEVKAEVAGEIVEILVQNAEPVEYGQVLFLIKASEYEA
jgi:acetyl-CoA carboxylase biotin carboxyl carrier protein